MLQTPNHKLKIRPVTLSDLEPVHLLHSQPETDEYNTLGIPASLTETEALLREWLAAQNEMPLKRYVFRIDTPDDVFMGLIGINLGRPGQYNAEIWYKLLPVHWSKGYATEVVKSILYYCFSTLGLHRVEAGCAVDNIASWRVMEKAGMLREGIKRKNLRIRDRWSDGYLYAILEEDFL